MYVVFVEYIVFYHRKQDYLVYMTKLKQENPTMELLESADQEGLFVEIWREVSQENFPIMKHNRIDNASSSNSELYEMIDHSKSQIRMWKFNQTYRIAF